MQINVAKTAFANLIDLVNDANAGLNLTTAQVTAGTPSAVAPDGAGRNTEVVLTAVTGQGYATGTTKTVKYERLGMLSGIATPPAKVEVAEGDTLAQVKTKVATALGLVDADIVASALTMPVDPETDGSVTIDAATNSLLYVAGDEVIVLNFPWPDLNASITVTDLNGYDAVV